MFQLAGINPTVCDGTAQGINKLAQSVRKNFEQLANGTGTILRFKLNNPLIPGGSAPCEIHRYDGSGFSRQRDGVIHDEEPGGLWEGFVGDEGWCTGRDGQKDHYSVVWMEHNTTAYPEPTTSANTYITNIIYQVSGGAGRPLRFYNNSGSTAPAGAYMRITGMTTLGTDAAYVIELPDSTLRRNYIVNVGDPVISGGSGYCSFLGSTGGYILTNSGTPAVDEEWGPVSGSWGLGQHRPGVIASSGATTMNGNAALIGKPYTISTFIGKADGTITKDNTTGNTVSVWTKNFASDTLLNIPSCCTFTSDIAAGDKVSGIWASGGPIVAKIAC